MQKKVEVDPLKAPILNLDVQLMLQTKQVKLSQGANSTSLQNCKPDQLWSRNQNCLAKI